MHLQVCGPVSTFYAPLKQHVKQSSPEQDEGSGASLGKPQLRANSKSLGTSTFRGFVPDVRTMVSQRGSCGLPRRGI